MYLVAMFVNYVYTNKFCNNLGSYTTCYFTMCGLCTGPQLQMWSFAIKRLETHPVELFFHYLMVLIVIRLLIWADHHLNPIESLLSFAGVCAVSFNCRWHWFRYGLLYPGEANRSLPEEVDRDVQCVPKPG